MDYLLPLAYVTLLWWLSTVLLLHRCGQPSRSYGATVCITGLLAVGGVALIVATRELATPAGAYLAFAGALAAWGFHETTYLLGYVSGPRPLACPADARGFSRFAYGVRASLYHELAIIATVALFALLTAGGANRVGLWTFAALGLMRWSTKLNIFFGVRNLHAEFWPPHLRYLQSYSRARRMNPVFPFSAIAMTVASLLLLRSAIDAAAWSFDQVAALLLFGIVCLGIIEHLFLMLRVPDELLWRAGTRSRREAG